MQRRQFVCSLAATGLLSSTSIKRLYSQTDHACHATQPTVRDAMHAPAEKFAFVPAILVGTNSKHADYMATLDVDRSSETYGQVVGRFSMPNPGDELHHYGWNACSSCHGERQRRYLIVPGLASGNIYVVDAADPARLTLHKTISARDIAERTNLSTPHTVHCRADGVIMVSMLGDKNGNAPGGFLEINQDFEVTGRWEKSTEGMHFNYDFWYQPRQNVMISSEWAAPNTVHQGFKLDDVQQGKYGKHINVWDWASRRIVQSIDLGESGLIPLEVRFHHNPDSTHGFVGAALSSAIHHFYREGKVWKAKKVIQVDSVDTKGWPFSVPGLITDLVLSLDDRFLYFANWLHGDVRQYDVSDPSQPKLTGQIGLGGVIGRESMLAGRNATGGPQMLQLSQDGKRLYVTSSLFSVWDNQFYPKMAQQGSWMLQIDCNTEGGGLHLNQDFYVDFGKEPWGPARAHEIRFPGGDCTSDIWV